MPESREPTFSDAVGRWNELQDWRKDEKVSPLPEFEEVIDKAISEGESGMRYIPELINLKDRLTKELDSTFLGGDGTYYVVMSVSIINFLLKLRGASEID